MHKTGESYRSTSGMPALRPQCTQALQPLRHNQTRGSDKNNTCSMHAEVTMFNLCVAAGDIQGRR